MDPELVARLADGPGRALLDSLDAYAADSALALSTQLRAAGHDPQLVSAVLAQARLRGLAPITVRVGLRVDGPRYAALWRQIVAGAR